MSFYYFCPQKGANKICGGHPAFLLVATILATFNIPLEECRQQGVMSDIMTEPHQLLSLDHSKHRLLGTYHLGDIPLLLPVEDLKESPKALHFKCLNPLL